MLDKSNSHKLANIEPNITWAEKKKKKWLYNENAEKNRAVAPSEKHFILYSFLILFHLSGLLFYVLCYLCNVDSYITPTPTATKHTLHIVLLQFHTHMHIPAFL